MADSIAVMLRFAGPDGACFHLNQAWLDFRGRSLDQEIGNGWVEGLHPDDRQHCLDTYLANFREHRDSQLVYRLRRGDGTYRRVLDRGLPWFMTNGSFAGFVYSIIDVTAHKQAEEETAKLVAILMGSEDAIISMTLDGIITSWNPGAERLYGFTADEVVGTHISVIHLPDRTSELADMMESIRRAQTVRRSRTLRRRKDGSLIDVSLAVFPILDNESRAVGASAITTDITEAVTLERHLQQAQKMEAVGQLAGGVAHDFNNLLTIINGYSQILMTRLGPNDPMRDLLAEIQKAGERAGTLTRQLLAFSRKQVLEPRVLDLNVEVTDMEKILRRLIGEDILLTTKLDPTLERVKVDPGQIQQVLMNLVVNARDAMPQGGKLTVETRNVRLDETYCQTHPYVQPGTYTMLAVSDTGIGLDQATKARIFEPFFTTKEPGKGTGLGLAMVYGIMKQSGGTIEVYSEPGRGATFKIYLPQVREPASSGKSLNGLQTIPKGSETLLLVEDEDAVRALAGHVLRSCGYTVLEATNGKEAVRLLEVATKPIDLLVSDVVMPHLGGRQLVKQLTTLRPGLKTLFLSGYTDDAIVRHGVLEEGFAFLQKPFTTIGLAQKVREVLDEKE